MEKKTDPTNMEHSQTVSLKSSFLKFEDSESDLPWFFRFSKHEKEIMKIFSDFSQKHVYERFLNNEVFYEGTYFQSKEENYKLYYLIIIVTIIIFR